MRIPLSLFALASVASTAKAEVEWHHATECQFVTTCLPVFLTSPGQGAVSPLIDCPVRSSAAFDVDGLTNRGTSVDIMITCPVSWTGDSSRVSSTSTFTVQYRDNNDTTTAPPEPTWCGAKFVDSSGNVFVGPGKYTCGTSGGCPGPDPGFVSPAGITTELVFPGLNGSWRNVAIVCLVPPYSIPTGHFSSVMSYQVQF